MKNLVKFSLILVVVFGLASTTFGQSSSANGVSAATIVTPINLTHDGGVSLDFGDIAVGTTETDIVVNAQTGDRSISGGGDAVFVGTNSSSDAFTVTGEDGEAFYITLPSSIQTVTDGTNTMDLKDFTSFPAVGSSPTISGSTPVKVGATLTVGATQAAGLYTGSYLVTVGYE